MDTETPRIHGIPGTWFGAAPARQGSPGQNVEKFSSRVGNWHAIGTFVIDLSTPGLHRNSIIIAGSSRVAALAPNDVLGGELHLSAQHKTGDEMSGPVRGGELFRAWKSRIFYRNRPPPTAVSVDTRLKQLDESLACFKMVDSIRFVITAKRFSMAQDGICSCTQTPH